MTNNAHTHDKEAVARALLGDRRAAIFWQKEPRYERIRKAIDTIMRRLKKSGMIEYDGFYMRYHGGILDMGADGKESCIKSYRCDFLAQYMRDGTLPMTQADLESIQRAMRACKIFTL